MVRLACCLTGGGWEFWGGDFIFMPSFSSGVGGRGRSAGGREGEMEGFDPYMAMHTPHHRGGYHTVSRCCQHQILHRSPPVHETYCS